MKVTPKQLRGGRVLSGLGVRELAQASGLSPTSISQIETGRTKTPHPATLDSLRAALEESGIEFGSNGWIRHVDDHQGEPGDRPTLLPDERVRVLRLLRQVMRILKEHQDGTEAKNHEGGLASELADDDF